MKKKYLNNGSSTLKEFALMITNIFISVLQYINIVKSIPGDLTMKILMEITEQNNAFLFTKEWDQC
jgi:hypothetical protein